MGDNQQSEPESEPFDIAELDRQGITDRHKLVIADCIMAWAKFDSNFRAMLTAIEDRNLVEGALDYDRLAIKVAWRKLKKALKSLGATEAVLETVERHETNYWREVVARNMIAHDGCVGVWRDDPEYLVFAPFATEGTGRMLLIRQPIEEIQKSTNWALAFATLAHQIMQSLGY